MQFSAYKRKEKSTLIELNGKRTKRSRSIDSIEELAFQALTIVCQHWLCTSTDKEQSSNLSPVVLSIAALFTELSIDVRKASRQQSTFACIYTENIDTVLQELDEFSVRHSYISAVFYYFFIFPVFSFVY
jgi:hypothetical protein